MQYDDFLLLEASVMLDIIEEIACSVDLFFGIRIGFLQSSYIYRERNAFYYVSIFQGFYQK